MGGALIAEARKLARQWGEPQSDSTPSFGMLESSLQSSASSAALRHAAISQGLLAFLCVTRTSNYLVRELGHDWCKRCKLTQHCRSHMSREGSSSNVLEMQLQMVFRSIHTSSGTVQQISFSEGLCPRCPLPLLIIIPRDLEGFLLSYFQVQTHCSYTCWP